MPAEVRQAMVDFWKEHSKQASMQEMMLDETADELNKWDLPEIMSYLPDFTGKEVLELGAGIGRFTSVIAEKAGKVTAADFMDDFIQKNKENNKRFTNISYEVADVTKMQRPQESFDLIFSNWLFMYLEDKESLDLFQKLLTWLRPGGYIFMRESCRHQSGNKSRTSNPTKYRNPEVYEAMYSTTETISQNSKRYGFELVFSKSVDTYRKMKQNNNQVMWLIQKVEKDLDKTQGYKTFQEFLDNQQYSSRGIYLYEKIFGRTFVSTGGLETTKEFVSMLDLKPGQKVLDVGGGIGGSAFYMAKEFGAFVLSIDLSSNMTQIGMERAEEVGCGPEQVVFELADATKRDYPAEYFDVVYSRDTILHIEDKLALFKQFHKFLKPGGKVLISDYCCCEGPQSPKFKKYVAGRGYNLLSPLAYGKVLEQAGFKNVKAEDKSEMFKDVLKSEIAKTEACKTEFIAEFDESGYNYIVDGWKEKLGRVEAGDQRWGLFYAEKL